MRSYFGKTVRVIKPTNAFSLWNEDDTPFGDHHSNHSWSLARIRLSDTWYALRGGGSRFSFISKKDGSDLGDNRHGSCGWHSLSVRQVKVEPKTRLERLRIFFRLKEPETELVMFGTLGSMESRIPQELLDQALSTNNKEDAGVYGSNVGGDDMNVDTYTPGSIRRLGGIRAPYATHLHR